MPEVRKAATDLVLPEISCPHCQAGLVENLQKMPGVKDVKVSMPKKRVEISFDPVLTSPKAIEKFLAGLGYSVKGH